MVGGGGGEDSTLVDLVSTESQGEGVRGVVMDNRVSQKTQLFMWAGFSHSPRLPESK